MGNADQVSNAYRVKARRERPLWERRQRPGRRLRTAAAVTHGPPGIIVPLSPTHVHDSMPPAATSQPSLPRDCLFYAYTIQGRLRYALPIG
jgi:hypothetical protein